MSKVISILNQKGGVGKSTISINLARAFQLDKKDVLLIDSDLQATAWYWRQRASDNYFPVENLPRVTENDIKRHLNKYEHVVIDGAAKSSDFNTMCLRASDIVLMPIQPSGADIWSARSLLELINTKLEKDKNFNAAFIISRQAVGTVLAREIEPVLRSEGLQVFKSRISNRVSYVEALNLHQTVLEYDKEGAAANEIKSLYRELKKRFL